MKILGISGSPIKNSNTDRLVQQILKSSELEYEFIKLSDINVKPCLGCKACVEDNICKVNDDFPKLSQKLRQADAVVVGGYTPYGMIDGFTKAFLERLWSMRHVHSLNEGKYAVSVISGLIPQAIEMAQNSLATEFSMEKMNHVASLNINGNVPCLTCGKGDNCKNSAVTLVFGEGIKASPDYCVEVENQEVFEKAIEVGKLIGQYVQGEKEVQSIV